MTHGRLTPLGRQLRTVLAHLPYALPSSTSLRHLRAHRPDARSCPRAWPGARHGAKYLHQSTATPSVAAAVADAHEGELKTDRRLRWDGKRFRDHSWRRLKRRTRINHLNEALTAGGIAEFAAFKMPSKADLSHLNIRSRNAWRDYRLKQRRHADDYRPAPCQSQDLSLQRILGSYLRHQARAKDYLDADWQTSFKLSPSETEYLDHQGFVLEDVCQWANAVSAPDSLHAAQMLAQRAPGSTPIFVYSHLLRRRHISPEGLRLFVKQVDQLFAHRAHNLQDPGIDDAPLLLVAIRLLRHAREVWPRAMVDIVELVVQHQKHDHPRPDNAKLAAITYNLNKLMSLVSLSTAAQPFRDNPYQEAAIVRVLQYMSEHDPPLHINRQGYRAVIRLQLAQGKTIDDQKWAELKALSWPPWKAERTAMDADITVESHGRSRAYATLMRMQSAGYRPLAWERAAQIYAGWDTDRTPTIQTRTLLGLPGARNATMLNRDDASWAARIDSTRTVQEAWACYLAWEDEKLPDDQGVFLATLQKLHAEDRRRGLVVRSGSNSAGAAHKDRPLLPGDGREISPPPSSTHLHTYTRTAPPTSHEFYERLIDRGICLKGHCLGFVVRHAPTVLSGLQRLEKSIPCYPEIKGLLNFDRSSDLGRLPSPVFTATVELYVRFTNVPFHRAQLGHSFPQTPVDAAALFPNRKLNPKHFMACAIELLTRRSIPEMSACNAVLRALSLQSNFAGLSYIFNERPAWLQLSQRFPGLSNGASNVEYREAVGAMNGYRLTQRIVTLLQERRVGLDAFGFQRLCLSHIHVVTAAWQVCVAAEGDESHGTFQENDALLPIGRDAKYLLRRATTSARLWEEFHKLVGDNEHFNATDASGLAASPQQVTCRMLSPLLTVPSSAVLHTFVRALGWAADFDGLLSITRWMRRYRSELAERQSMDRDGHKMMRKVLTALRVFLERNWIVENGESGRVDAGTTGCTTTPTVDARPHGESLTLLQRLQRPASPELIGMVRELVEKTDAWGGWPTDDEVHAYIRDKSFHGYWRQRTAQTS